MSFLTSSPTIFHFSFLLQLFTISSFVASILSFEAEVEVYFENVQNFDSLCCYDWCPTDTMGSMRGDWLDWISDMCYWKCVYLPESLL
jgi:hypothetical protein